MDPLFGFRNLIKLIIRRMRSPREETQMALEIPAELVPQINEIKARIDSLNKEGELLQDELDAIKSNGVEIKLVIKSIEEIDVEEIQMQFLAVVQSREEKLESIVTQIKDEKEKLAKIVTDALLGS